MQTAVSPNNTTYPWHHLRAMRTDMIGYLEHLAAQGDFLRIPLGLGSAYFVNHPDYARAVLTAQANKFHKPAGVKITAEGLFGQNLFTSDGELWRALRKVMQPAFHTRRIQAYAEVMVAYTEEMLVDWQPDHTIDVPAAMMNLTLAVTTKALFNADMRNPEAEQAIIRFIELFNRRVAGLPLPMWLPTRTNREMKQHVATIERLLIPLIESRRADGVDTGDVLSMLLLAQEADESGLLTDRQVLNEVLNLFAAGYEVTAHSLAFTLYLVARHPDVETRLLAELDEAVGQRRVTVADLEKLPYLEMVLKEAMRLLPVTAVVTRQTTEPVSLNGYLLPQNRLVLVAPWTLHRHPDFYEEPERFDPERFSPARKSEIRKFAYLPFSTGPRICLGNAFAMLQMQLNLATILQRYRLALPTGYQFEPYFSFNTRPKDGLPMKVVSR